MSRFRFSGPQRRGVLLLIGAIVTVAVLVIVISGPADSEGDCGSYRFDRSGWKDDAPGPEAELGPRQKIADRAIACRFFVGKSKREVIALLGRPYGDSTERELLWGIGLERGPFKLDGEYLLLQLDSHDRVRRAKTTSY